MKTIPLNDADSRVCSAVAASSVSIMEAASEKAEAVAINKTIEQMIRQQGFI
ncbi:MAG: hypothetical protein R2861_13940 [Desulfobacterales bacterium]